MATLPQRLGPYVLEAELGRGAMGVVYRARDTRVDRVVAIKLVLTEGELQAQRFEHEARSAARLRHKNIVAVHDLAVEGSRLYLVSEFVQGRSLQDLLKERGRLEPERAAELTARLCEGVEHAHQAGVIHRDIKPDNVLLVGEEPRLTDFGIARIDSGGLTKTGQLLGTPAFMPPEQAGGERKRIGPRSDVYSLGATLYALLTGQAPFAAGSTYATVTAVLTKEPLAPSQLAPVPPELEAIVLGALAKDPQERPPSAAALGQALRDWRTGITRADVHRGHTELGRRVLGLGLVIVLIAGGVGLWFGSRAMAPPTLAQPPTPSPSHTPTPSATRSHKSPLARAEPLWHDPDRIDGDAALANYLARLKEGREGACESLAEVLVANHGEDALRESAIAALASRSKAGLLEATLALARVHTKGRSADPQRAQAYCADLERQGEGRGFRWLGDYWRARGDRRQAEIFYLAAKRAGDQEARVRLGALLIARRSRDTEGFVYLAAAEGDEIASASRVMGNAHRFARGVERDLGKAEHYYREAIRRGDREATYQLATLLRLQERPYRSLLEQAAREGHAQAAGVLSRLLLESEPARALRWTRFAASRGYPPAAVWLAEHHLLGQGVPRDPERGLRLLRVATQRGNPRAACALGRELERRERVAEARALWRDALERTQDAEAMGLLAASLLDREPKPADRSEALELLHRAADRSDPASALRLAEAYEHGPERPLGLAVDLKRALQYYLLGARARNTGEDVARVTEKLSQPNASPTSTPARQ